MVVHNGPSSSDTKVLYVLHSSSLLCMGVRRIHLAISDHLQMTDNSLFAGLGGMKIAQFGRREMKESEPSQATTATVKFEREFFCLPLRDLRLIVTDKISRALEVSDHSRAITAATDTKGKATSRTPQYD